MKRHIGYCLLLPCFLLAITGLGQESVLFKEDFASYQVDQRPAGFNKSCIVKEENGRKFLSYPGGYGLILDSNMMKYFGAQKWRDIELSFRFRFTDPKKIGFSTVLKSGGFRPEGVKYLLYYVGIRQDSVDAIPMNSTASKEEIERCTIKKVLFIDKGLQPLQVGQWYTAKAIVKDSSLAFFLEKDGQMLNVFNGESMPGGGGIDFLTYNPVDFADIIVIEPESVQNNIK